MNYTDHSGLNKLKRRNNLITLFICIIGIALNIFLSLLASAFDLPLYLDTVGTVTVASMGGYLPAAVVGFITNLIKCTYDPSSLYYGLINVIIAVAASALADRGWFNNPKGIVYLILVFTLIGGGLGAFIPWYMDGLTFDAESLSGMLFSTGYLGLGFSGMGRLESHEQSRCGV